MDKDLTLEQIIALKEGFEHYFPFEMGLSPNTLYVSGPWASLSSPKNNKWLNRDDFWTSQSEITGVQKLNAAEIKNAYQYLDNLERGMRVKSASEKVEQTQTTISEKTHEQAFREAERREAAGKEARESAQRDVKRAQETQQKLYEERVRKTNADAKLKEKVEELQRQNREQQKRIESVQEEATNKKIYAVVEKTKEIRVDPKEKAVFENYKQYIQQLTSLDEIDATVNKLSQEIEQRVSPSLKESGLTEDQINFISKQTAVEIVENLKVNDSPSYVPIATQDAVLTSISQDTKVLPKVVTKEAQEVIRSSAKNVSVVRILPDQIVKSITKTAFGDRFSSLVFGPDTKNLKVTLSSVPIPNQTVIIDLGQVNQGNSQLLSNQNITLESIKNLEINRGNFLFQKAEAQIQNRITSLSETSISRRVLHTSATQDILFSTFKQGEAIDLGRESQFIETVLKISPEQGNFFDLLGKMTGLDFSKQPSLSPLIDGITQRPTTGMLATETASKIGGSLAGQAVTSIGAQAAAKTGLAGLISKFASFISLVGGWAGIATRLIINFVTKVIIENQRKIKKLFENVLLPVAAILLGVGFITGSVPILSVGGSLMGAGLLAGNSPKNLVAGVGSFFSKLGAVTAQVLMWPVVTIVIGIPILIAFFMLVINNSSYIIPPSPLDNPFGGGHNSGIKCTEEQPPVGFTNNSSSPIATRAWEIMTDMYQGFWCFWNRSPGDLPTDKITYPPSYPNLFNMDLFNTNPNPTRDAVSDCGECLFWCTWLVQKAYTENGLSIQYTLWSPSMQADFTNRGKFIPSSQVTPSNLAPGSVIFFDVANSLNRTDHVGIAHTITQDGVSFVQSNAGTKEGLIPFNSNGIGLQNLLGITVVGIGLP